MGFSFPLYWCNTGTRTKAGNKVYGCVFACRNDSLFFEISRSFLRSVLFDAQGQQKERLKSLLYFLKF